MGAALSPIGMVAGLAGSLVSGMGAQASGQAQAQNAQYQAQVAMNNAQVAKQNAAWDIGSGEIAASNQGMKTRATVGSEKAAQGASGVDVNTGSAVDVRAGTASLGRLDQMTTLSNASKKAYADQVQASNDTAQSQLDTQEAGQDKAAGNMSALGTLLGGVAGTAGKYANWSNVGSGNLGTG